MSLASLAAAATVYDHIDDVVRDTRIRRPVATAAIVQYGIASVDCDGRVTMSDRQSATAARMIANMATAW
jgi:hypothetical protein